MYYIIEYIETT